MGKIKNLIIQLSCAIAHRSTEDQENSKQSNSSAWSCDREEQTSPQSSKWIKLSLQGNEGKAAIVTDSNASSVLLLPESIENEPWQFKSRAYRAYSSDMSCAACPVVLLELQRR